VARTLGVDVGTVRVGIALSDPLGYTAQPLEVILRKKTDPFARIAALVAEREVTLIVVGYPLTLAGEVGPSAQSVDAFITELATKVTVPIERWDERLTTAAAERSMIEGGARRTERRASIDKIAAALLLQSYMDAKTHA